MYFGFTLELAKRVFPFTSFANLEHYLPDVAKAAESCSADRTTFLLALATIRAEVESFVPCCEEVSRYNTSIGGRPFDLYDYRRELGNQGPPDGERFRGRGYVQLIGKNNYSRLGTALSFNLLRSPEAAAESYPAARILFRLLREKEEKLHRSVALGELACARRLINGGFHGVKRFREAFQLADSLLPPC